MQGFKFPLLLAVAASLLGNRISPTAAAGPDPALIDYSEGLEELARGQWDQAAGALARAQAASPSDARFALAHAVALGLGEKCQDAVLELARMPKKLNARPSREPEFWTYVFETMGGFATAEHMIGGARYGEGNIRIVPNQAVSIPGNVVQGGDDYPTDFASFVYYEVAMNGYYRARESHRAPDPKMTGRLRVQAGRWFAARFQASPDLALAHLERAKKLNSEQKFADSLREINFARIPYPQDPTLAYYTADAWLGLGWPVSARREATYSLIGQTRSADGYLDRAVAASRLGDAARAKADLAIATQLDAKAAARYRDAIEKNLSSNTVTGDPLTILAHLQEAIRSGASAPDLLAQSKDFHRAAGARRKRYDESYQDRLRQLEAAILAKPKSPDLKVELAIFLTDESRLGRRSEAVEPRRPMMPYRERPDETAELNRAIELCDEALKSDPKHVRALMQKALALSRLDRDGEAESIVQQVLSIAPKNPEALRLRAKYWTERANNLSLQAVDLRTPRSVSSSHTENRSDGVYRVSTTTYYPPTSADIARAGELDAAAEDLFRRSEVAISAALEVSKGTFDGQLLLADVQFARRQADAAEATLKKAIAQKPQSTEANEALVDLYLKTGRTDEAELHRSVTTQLFQTSAGWLLKQGWKKIVARDFAGARTLLDTARSLDPEDARVPAYWGVIDQAEGKPEDAKGQFRLALLLEEGRLALDEPIVHGPAPAHNAQEFGLAIRLRQLLAASAPPEEALDLYTRNAAAGDQMGPGGRAVQMFSAMLPQPGAEPIPVPAPVNMATLTAESHLAAGKVLQALGRTTEAQAQFAAATQFGPKAGVPNIGGRNGNLQESNFAGNAGGQTAEAYIELAKGAIQKKDFKAAAGYMSQASRLQIPRDRLVEVNNIQMEIARGMRGW